MERPTHPAKLANQLEPAGLTRHFLEHAPAGFSPFETPDGLPGFVALFDLLTTADAETLALVSRFPANAWLRRLLRWPTCFFGTTVTEYMPLLTEVDSDALLQRLLAFWDRRSRLLILKDIPVESALLPAEERVRSRAFIEACQRAGCLIVEGQALAYVAIDFRDQEAYLGRLSAGRRRDIRRKLRSRDQVRVEILPTGDERFSDAAFRQQLYALYLQVYEQSELHFDKLAGEFFAAVFQDASLDGQVFLYTWDDQLIGFNLCFVHQKMLIDKFVGFRYPQARQCNLYFLSWMENLEFARSRGLTHYVAGWTDPEIKAYLGAQFTFTRHAVYVRNPVLRALLKKLTGRFERDRAWFDEHQDATAPRP